MQTLAVTGEDPPDPVPPEKELRRSPISSDTNTLCALAGIISKIRVIPNSNKKPECPLARIFSTV